MYMYLIFPMTLKGRYNYYLHIADDRWWHGKAISSPKITQPGRSRAGAPHSGKSMGVTTEPAPDSVCSSEPNEENLDFQR